MKLVVECKHVQLYLLKTRNKCYKKYKDGKYDFYMLAFVVKISM